MWFYIIFFKSKKRQPSMLSWNDRPIPFTGKENPGEMCCRKRMFVLSLSQLRDSSTPSLYIVYIYIDFLFSCAVVGPKKRICWLSSTSWHPWNMQLVVLPFHFKGSSVLKYSIFFSYSLEDAPTPNQDIFFMSQYWNDFETHLEIPMVQSTLTSGVLH